MQSYATVNHESTNREFALCYALALHGRQAVHAASVVLAVRAVWCTRWCTRAVVYQGGVHRPVYTAGCTAPPGNTAEHAARPRAVARAIGLRGGSRGGQHDEDGEVGDVGGGDDDDSTVQPSGDRICFQGVIG